MDACVCRGMDLMVQSPAPSQVAKKSRPSFFLRVELKCQPLFGLCALYLEFKGLGNSNTSFSHRTEFVGPERGLM